MSSITTDKLRHEIQRILKDADLNTLSSKKVRQMLETIFKCDFTERKKEIDDILMAEITSRDITPINIEQTPDKECEVLDNDVPITTEDQPITIESSQQENQQSIDSTTNTAKYKKPTAPSLKLERRRTCYNKEMDISDQLAVIVGGHQMPRSEVVRRMWVYFKEHNLMDPVNKQWVNCDDALAKLFGRKRIRAFGMLKGLSRHMSDPDKYQ